MEPFAIMNEEEPQLQHLSDTHNRYRDSFTHHSGNKGSECIPDGSYVEEFSTDTWGLLVTVTSKCGRTDQNNTERLQDR